MPVTTDQAEPSWDYSNWVPPDPPDISDVDWWTWNNPPWLDGVVNRPVDHTLTQLMHEKHQHRVRCGGFDGVERNRASGCPFQRVDTVTSTTKVYEHSRSRFLYWPTVRVPLPDVVRLFGDPKPVGSDAQALLVDGRTKTYWELSACGPSFWFEALIAPWRAGSIVKWDLTKPWMSQRGITAAKIPLLPMLPTFEQYDSGYIGHALQLAAAGYSNQWIPPARDSDGKTPGHPLRAGTRLRLRSDARTRLIQQAQLTYHDRVLLDCLTTYGAIVCDYTDPEQGDLLRQPMDNRINVTVELTRRDFDILAA